MILLHSIISLLKGAGYLGKAGAILAWSVPALTTIAISEIVLGQLIAAVPNILATLVALYVLKTGQNRNAATMDGKLTALMKAEVAAAESKGREDERQAETARQGAAALAQQTAAPAIVENPPEKPKQAAQ